MALSDLTARLRHLAEQLQSGGKYDPATDSILNVEGNRVCPGGGNLTGAVASVLRDARTRGDFVDPSVAEIGLLVDGAAVDLDLLEAIFGHLQSRGFMCWGVEKERGSIERLADTFDALPASYALNIELNGLIGRRIEVRAPDGRVFVVPPTEHRFTGDPVPLVLDIEAATRARLKDGSNPREFIRLFAHFRERRYDPNGGATFAEYMAVRHPELIEGRTESPKPMAPNAQPDPDEVFTPLAFTDLTSRKTYTFKRPLLWELWKALWPGKRRWTYGELPGQVPHWKDAPVTDDAFSQAVKDLRAFWREQGRSDLANRINVNRRTVGFTRDSIDKSS